MASSSSASNSKVREGIRQAVAAPMCKKLVWRACREALPVKSLLRQKGIIESDDTCPCCGEGKETTTHALLQCEEVKRIWLASPLGHRVDSLQNINSMLQWMDQCVDALDKEAIGMVCAIVGALWQKRNAWLLKREKLDFKQVMAKASSMLILDEWVPPPDPYLKANFSSFVLESVGTGLAVVFRNSSGAPMASGTSFIYGECYDMDIAEAICYRWAMEQSQDLCFSHVIFETDCEQLYTQWKQIKEGETDDNVCYLYSVLEDCEIITERTRSSLILIGSMANKLARFLATVAFDYGEERVWIEEVPNEVSLYLHSDIAAIASLSDDE